MVRLGADCFYLHDDELQIILCAGIMEIIVRKTSMNVSLHQ